MKVVLINHGTADQWGGGDSVQIRETAKRLRQRGHEVSIQNSDKPDVTGAQIAHIFNCRVYNSLRQQVETCKKASVPIVISPIWMPLGRAMWGSRAMLAVLNKGIIDGEKSIQNDLKGMRERKLAVNIDGKVYRYGSIEDGGIDWIEDVSRILNEADGVLTNSWMELKSLQLDLKYSKNNYDIGYYGVDTSLFQDKNPEIFRKATGINEPFVMQAGRIEPGKNQAMLCWALRKTNIKIVLIGGSKHWPAYAELCKKISGDNLKIIEHVNQDMLASAYSASRVHCLASWMDTCGLVSLEAGLCGTPLVGSTFGHELEYLQNDAWLADPGDENSVIECVENAWNAGRYCERSVRLKKRILSKYNWEQMASATERLYKNIIERS